MYPNVDANNIAVAQSLFAAGNAVANDIVDGGTDRRRERGNSRSALLRRNSSIADITGNSSSTANILLGNLVDFGGCHTRYQVRAYDFIRFSDDTSRFAQLRDLLL